MPTRPSPTPGCRLPGARRRPAGAVAAALAGLLAVLLAALLGPASPAAAADPDALGGPQLGVLGRALPVGAPPLPPQVVAHGWLVADLDSGAVLAAQDAHGRFAPASTLKILTAVALAPRLPDLTRKVVPTFDDINVDGTRVGLVERVGYPVDELFTAMMMVSGNDVANTLATAAGGPAAIQAMNDTATDLQARDTHAVNPTGLDAAGQTSSAYDLALLARAGMKSPDFRRWVSTVHGSVSGPGGKRIETYSHDRLLEDYPGALGIKNGYTNAAKASFVGAATRDGRTLVVTLMRTQPRVDKEAAALLDWGFTVARLGLAPVGQLVDPLSAARNGQPGPTPTAGTAGAAGAVSAGQVTALPPVGPGAAPSALDPRAASGRGGTLEVQVLSAGAVVVAVVALRRRRARRRPAGRPLPRRAGVRG
jgi:D-alanyl-D-alanine carboxypeptidase (penicillin-binding protein 5/6)